VIALLITVHHAYELWLKQLLPRFDGPEPPSWLLVRLVR
jgi:hypothetical protein